MYVIAGCGKTKCLQCSCSASTAACARATRTDRSALPIRNFPSSERTIYLASSPWHAASNLVIMDTFLFCDCGNQDQDGGGDAMLVHQTYGMSGTHSNFLEVTEDEGHGKWFGFEERLLAILRILEFMY